MSVTSIKIGSKPSISVDYSGQGEMVLFLHGIGGNKKNWKNNISFFF
jgi:3-oxoadipate enol-lactonase